MKRTLSTLGLLAIVFSSTSFGHTIHKIKSCGCRAVSVTYNMTDVTPFRVNGFALSLTNDKNEVFFTSSVYTGYYPSKNSCEADCRQYMTGQ